MNRVVLALAATAIFVAASLFLFLPGCAGEDDTEQTQPRESNRTHVPEPRPPSPTDVQFPTFALATEVEIAFDCDDVHLATFTPREHLDQLVDWMLLAVLNDAGLTIEELNEVVHDLPAFRDGFERSAIRFEHGPVRSRMIKDDVVIALIPRDLPPTERDRLLAAVLDEERKNHDVKPARLGLFEYKIEDDRRRANIVRQPLVSARDFFENGKHGYFETTITSLDDLRGFIERTDDVTYVETRGGRLVLGGRAVDGFLGAELEHVAALWQAENQVQKKLAVFEAESDAASTQLQQTAENELEAIDRRYEAGIDRLNRQLGSRSRTELQAEADMLEQVHTAEAERVVAQFETDLEGLRVEWAKTWQEQGLVEGTGFSLDPAFNYGGLAEFVDRLAADMKRLEDGTLLAENDADWSAILDNIEQGEMDPFWDCLENLGGRSDVIGAAVALVFSAAEKASRGSSPPDDATLANYLDALAEEIDTLRADTDALDLIRQVIQRDTLDAGTLAELHKKIDGVHGTVGDALAVRILGTAVGAEGVGVERRVGAKEMLLGVEREWGELEQLATVLDDVATRVKTDDSAAAYEAWAGGIGADRLLATGVRELLADDRKTLDREGETDLRGFAWSIRSLATDTRRLLANSSFSGVRRALVTAADAGANGDAKPFDDLLGQLEAADSEIALRLYGDLVQAMMPFREIDAEAARRGLEELVAVVEREDDDDPLAPTTLRSVAAALREGDAAAGEEWRNGLFTIIQIAAFLGDGSGSLSMFVLGDLDRAGDRDGSGLRSELQTAVATFKALGSSDDGPLAVRELQDIASALSERDELPVLKMIDRLGNLPSEESADLARQIDDKSERDYRFQAARYDGALLQGTTVGMVLFYTDLLAKLWAIDFEGSTPTKKIDDFIPMTAQRLSPVFAQESLELPNTRLWFGHQSRGIRVGKEGSTNRLSMGRYATRIYAASSNPLVPGQEMEAAADAAAFLGWWNDHYEEVALYETQYQRLNAIMKWGVLLAWIGDLGHFNQLSFLSSVEVKRDHWFEHWAEANGTTLAFNDWTSVGFHAPGYHGSTTEALPLLRSRPYTGFSGWMVLSGGVSLPSRSSIQLVKPIARGSLPKHAGRPGIVAESVTKSGRRVSFEAMDGTRVQLADGVTTTTLRPNAISRAVDAELAPRAFQTRCRRTGGTLVRTDTVHGKGSGVIARSETRVDVVDGVVRIQLRPRETVTMRRLVRRASETPGDTAMELLADPDVMTVMRLQDFESFLVELNNGRWITLRGEVSPTARIGEQVYMRGGSHEGIFNYDVKVLSEAEAWLLVKEHGVIRVPLEESVQGRRPIELVARGPPPPDGASASSATLAGDVTVPARLSDGLYIATSEFESMGTAAQRLQKISGLGGGGTGGRGPPLRTAEGFEFPQGPGGRAGNDINAWQRGRATAEQTNRIRQDPTQRAAAEKVKLEQVDRYLQGDQPLAALRGMDEMQALGTQLEHLHWPTAAAHVTRGDFSKLRTLLSLDAPTPTIETAIGALERRLANEAGKQAREQLGSLLRYARYYRTVAAGRAPPRPPRWSFEDGIIRTIHRSEEIAHTRLASVEDVISANADLYLAGESSYTTTLRTTFETTLREAVEGGTMRILRLQAKEIAQARPDRLALDGLFFDGSPVVATPQLWNRVGRNDADVIESEYLYFLVETTFDDQGELD